MKKFLSLLLALALAVAPATPALPQLTLTGSGPAESGDLDLTETDNACLSTSGTVQTFTAKKLGSGKPGRILAVLINWSDSTLAGTAEITGVTVDGNAMARATRAVGDNQNSNSEIWYVQVSSGSTGDVVVTASTAVDGMTIAIYRLVNYTLVAPLSSTTGTTTATVTGLLTGYATLAAASRRENVSTSLANLTNNYSSACGTFLWGVHASNLAAGSGGITTTISPTTDTPLIAMAVWSNSNSWVPLALGAALRTWWQMNLLTGSNGSAQPVVPDSSGNGFEMDSVFDGTLAAADLNGLNTLLLNASGGRYTVNRTSLSAASAASGYFIYKISTPGNYTTYENGSGGFVRWPFADGRILDSFASSTAKDTGTPAVALTTYRIMSIMSGSGDYRFYIDGGAGGSGGGTSPYFSTGTNAIGFVGGSFIIGGDSVFNTMDGWFAEIFWTDAVQTDADRQKAEGYLACKWGLQGNLSASHPYKSSCPTL